MSPVPIGDAGGERAAHDRHVRAALRADQRAMRELRSPIRLERRAHRNDRIIREIERGLLVQDKRHVVLERKRTRDPAPRRHGHPSTARRMGRRDGLFDRLGNGRVAQLCAIVRDRKGAFRQRPLHDRERKRRALHDARTKRGLGAAHAHQRQQQQQLVTDNSHLAHLHAKTWDWIRQ